MLAYCMLIQGCESAGLFKHRSAQGVLFQQKQTNRPNKLLAFTAESKIPESMNTKCSRWRVVESAGGLWKVLVG